MIFKDENIFIDICIDGKCFSKLSLIQVEELLSEYKNIDLMSKEMSIIPNCYAYFNSDINNNKFTCKIYKTSFGLDRWIMLMKDDYEGYALYKNPNTHEYELAWYHSELEKPLDEIEEKKMISCYIPSTNN
ncbi:MAG: hypothetical protein E7Z85_03305 [Methanosphaera stadtmanae]|nr:hypothetical protein [Methanosphaera stadtmanae]